MALLYENTGIHTMDLRIYLHTDASPSMTPTATESPPRYDVPKRSSPLDPGLVREVLMNHIEKSQQDRPITKLLPTVTQPVNEEASWSQSLTPGNFLEIRPNHFSETIECVQPCLQTIGQQADRQASESPRLKQETIHPNSSSGGHVDLFPDWSPLSTRDPELDMDILNRSRAKLVLSGFYYPGMTMLEAKQKLRPLTEGTFLIRDSSHPEYIFSLSTKTVRGTTSVRIEYEGGCFRLDSDNKDHPDLPKFDCVLKMLDFYTKSCVDKPGNRCVWLESSGRKDTPVVLKTPFKDQPPKLRHLCRLKINSIITTKDIQNVPTLSTLDKNYLIQYPSYL